MWGNNCIGTDGGSEAWIPQQVQVCGDARPELQGSDSTSSETEDVSSAVLRALDTCRTNHQFIASQAEHLQRLRSQCANSAVITKQEIRKLEEKLVRLFGQQLACKRRLPVCASLPTELHAFPCLSQWLSVVGLSSDAIQAACESVGCLETLLGLADAEVCALLASVAGAAWHTSKLQRALYHLRRYTVGQMQDPPVEVEGPLNWDSWEQHPQQRGSCPSSPRTLHKPSPHGGHREARSSVSSSDGDMSDMGGSFTTSGTLPSGGINHHHHHHHHQHRSSDESSTPSSPPVMGLTHPHHHHHHHHLHHYSSSGGGGGNTSNNVSPNKPLPPPSPLHPPSTPSLTLQLPPSSTPVHDLRYTPPTTPPVIKTPKAPDKKGSTPPPNKKFLLINTPGSGNASSGSLGRSTSHESQLAARRAGDTDATNNCNTATTPTSTTSHYTNNTMYVAASNTNSHSANTTPPHNANEMLIVSPNAANISHDMRHHSRHQSESSNDLPPYTPHSHDLSRPSPASISGSHASLTQQAPPTSLASPTRHHYNHPHPYQQHTDDDNYNKNSTVPRSPRTPPLQGSMVHNVQHRFTKSINIKPATCGYCHQKFPILGGLRCKECNFKCHRECESKLPPSCGLPTEYLKIFTEVARHCPCPVCLQSLNNSLQNSNRGGGGVGGVSPSHQPDLRTPPMLPTLHHAQHNQHTFQGPDSSSNTSSCNSSTPSSPALILPPPSPATLSSSSSSNSGKHLHHQQLQQQHQQQIHHHHHHQQQQQQHQQQQQQAPLTSSAATHHEAFHYPDVTKQRVAEAWGNFPLRGPPPSSATPSVIHSLTSTTSSTLSATSSTRSDLIDSDRTTISTNSGSGSTDDSERTVAERVDSQDSTISDGLVDSGGGNAGDGGASSTGGPVAGEGCSRQNSVSQGLREWDIPYNELDKGKIIGRGRFGTVYSGNWHGQVAIKELHMEYGNDQNTLEAFRSEVSMFRKTRHQNLVLFMGACMKLPRLAIITSLCKGNTLYKHIHVLRDKFTMSNTISIAQQVAQGMGYLHARGIVHKDLKSKNIFIENGKVVITDFGLVNVTRLCQNNRIGAWLSIPAGWLCYLSPELMRALQVSTHQPHSLPHTTTTDVYSYGTVWFELLCGEWPHKGLPPEAIIWQVGRGIKPSLAHLQASRDVKDILMECWSYRPDERPDFASLQKQLKKLPKKRLARSPSHPIHLSRSAECVF